MPPSLRNIFKEIARDGASDRTIDLASKRALTGSLDRWARQGVLLLNTCLTVEQGQPARHAKQGWEGLTDAIIQAVWANTHPTVFMLWGAHAQAKQSLMLGDSLLGERVGPSLGVDGKSPFSLVGVAFAQAIYRVRAFRSSQRVLASAWR